MQYLIVFLEGIITFISPCILPMLPIYLSYLAGDIEGEAPGDGNRGSRKLIVRASGFTLGFAALFIALGAAAGTFGYFVSSHTTFINILSGAVMILFGLNFTGLIRIGFLNGTRAMSYRGEVNGFLPAVLFGFIFAISWSPCVGAFLGSALAMAAVSGTALKGVAMLALYSAGLGIPFIISALLLSRLETAFSVIRKHHRPIGIAAGLLLIIMGILTALGLFNIYAGFLIN